jgi:hypothetical protein
MHMARGPFESVFDQVVAKVAQQTGDPNRGKAPYAVFGAKTFEASDGVPPRVFAKKGSATLEDTLDRGGYGVSGSIAAWRQEIVWRVWGANENEVFNEARNLLRAIATLTFDGYTSLVGTSGQWYPNDSDRDWNGEVFEFTTPMPISVANGVAPLVTILTASGWVSSSLTGSYTLGSLSGSVMPSGKWTPWHEVIVTSSL